MIEEVLKRGREFINTWLQECELSSWDVESMEDDTFVIILDSVSILTSEDLSRFSKGFSEYYIDVWNGRVMITTLCSFNPC